MNLKDLSRPLDISDVDFRVQSINNGGYATILAYKDARVDMNRLDEVCGIGYWKKDYRSIDGRLYCGVAIYNDVISEWIWKWDVGTESMTEKEKGMASDAFKRACFNIGIGRELYDYPIISVKLNDNEYTKDGGRPKQTFNLKIRDWRWYSEFTDGRLSFIAAKDESGKLRFKWGEMKPKVEEPTFKQAAASPIVETEVIAVEPIAIATESEEADVSGFLKKPIDTDPNREILAMEYKAIYGKLPHGKMSSERISEEINKSINLIEDEEVNVPEAEMEASSDAYSLLVEEARTYKSPGDFVGWAKGIVAELTENNEDSTLIDSFKTFCNTYYAELTEK